MALHVRAQRSSLGLVFMQRRRSLAHERRDAPVLAALERRLQLPDLHACELEMRIARSCDGLDKRQTYG